MEKAELTLKRLFNFNPTLRGGVGEVVRYYNVYP